MGEGKAKAEVPIGSVGTGLIYSWMWATFWSYAVLPNGVFGEAEFLLVLLVWRGLKLLTFLWLSLSKGSARVLTPFALGVLGAAGTLLMAVTPWLSLLKPMELVLVCVGAAIFAISESMLLVLWNATYVELEYECILKNSALFIGFGAASFLILFFVGAPIATALICALPVLSAILLRSLGGRGDASKADWCSGGGTRSSRANGTSALTRKESFRAPSCDDSARSFSLPNSLVVSAVLISVANGYIRGAGSSFAGENPTQALVLFVSIVLMAYLIFASNSLKAAYTGSFLLVSAGLLAQLLLPDAGTALIGIGFICFELAMWVLIAALAKKHGMLPYAACSKVWLILETGMMVGTLVGIALKVSLTSIWSVPAVDVFSMGLAYAILALLSVASTKPFLSIIEDEISAARVYDDYQKKVDAAAREYELTPRETEILQLIAYGRDVKAVENLLFISTNTVKTHFRHIYAKFGVTKKQELLDKIEEQETGVE